MKLKDNVKLHGLDPAIIIAIIIANDIWKEFGQELVITSALDGQHNKNSLHYIGKAIDLRTNYFSKDDIVDKVIIKLKERLNNEFDIVVGTNYIHIEHQPEIGEK